MRFSVRLFLLLLLGVLFIPTQMQSPVTPVRPSDLTGGFWVVDYFDTDGAGVGADPIGQITTHPTPSNPLNVFEPDSFQMSPGSGYSISSVSGCNRRGGKVFFGTQQLEGVKLSELSTLSYSFLIADNTSINNTTGLPQERAEIAPYLNIFVDKNNDGIWRGGVDSILVFEPYYTRQVIQNPPNFGLAVWNSYTVIGSGADGRWHTAAQSLATIGATAPNTNDLWSEIIALPFNGGTVGDLKIVNPDPGCSGTASDSAEGTASGFVFAFGQKNGDAYREMVAHIDNITLEVGGTIAPLAMTTYDLTLSKTPALITATAGTPQSAMINTAFAQNLTVKLTDSFGNPVEGTTVTFTAPAAGASVSFPNSDTAITDANGEASVSVVANGSVGDYTVTANITPALLQAAEFALTNLAVPPVTTQLLMNGGFEDEGDTPALAAFWTPSNLKSKDKRVCGLTNVPQGTCVFQFNFIGDSNARRAISQNVTPTGDSGDILKFNAKLSANNLTNGARLVVRVIYLGGGSTTLKIIAPAGTYGYTLHAQKIILTDTVTSIKVSAQAVYTTGRLRIDQVRLVLKPQ